MVRQALCLLDGREVTLMSPIRALALLTYSVFLIPLGHLSYNSCVVMEESAFALLRDSIDSGIVLVGPFT